MIFIWLLWITLARSQSFSFTNDGNYPVQAASVVYDSAADVLYFTGSAASSFDNQVYTPTPGTYYASFTTKSYLNGTHIWTRIFNATTNNKAYAIVQDTVSGDVMITGYSAGDLFGISAQGGQNIFIARFNSNGTMVFFNMFGPGGTGLSLLMDSSQQNVILGARYLGGSTAIVNFSNGSVIQWFQYNNTGGSYVMAKFNPSSQDIFIGGYSENYNPNVLRVNPYNGSIYWQQEWLPIYGGEVWGLVFDSCSQTIFATGYTCGGFNGQPDLGDPSYADAFVIALSPNGTILWTLIYGTIGDDYVNTITIHPVTGNLFLGGRMNESYDSVSVIAQNGTIIVNQIFSQYVYTSLNSIVFVTPNLGIGADVGMQAVINVTNIFPPNVTLYAAQSFCYTEVISTTTLTVAIATTTSFTTISTTTATTPLTALTTTSTVDLKSTTVDFTSQVDSSSTASMTTISTSQVDSATTISTSYASSTISSSSSTTANLQSSSILTTSATSTPTLSATSTLQFSLAISLQFPQSISNNTESQSTGDSNSQLGLLNGTNYLYIVAGAAGLLLIVAGIATAVILRKRKSRVEKRKLTTSNTSGTATMSSSTTATSSSTEYTSKSYDATNATNMMTTAMMTQNATWMRTDFEMSLPGFLQIDALESFMIERKLAQGGGGAVFLANSINSKLSLYGAKIIVKVVGDNQKLEELSERIRRAFKQEISIMHYFREEKFIAKLLGWSDDPACMVMKFYQLGSLDRWISSESAIKTHRIIINFMMDISQGILAMHNAGFVHCDLKPQNILLDQDERGRVFCVLTDFGITNIVSSQSLLVDHFEVENLRGLSIQYAAPEVFERFRMKHRPSEVNGYLLTKADLYSFAIIQFDLLDNDGAWR